MEETNIVFSWFIAFLLGLLVMGIIMLVTDESTKNQKELGQAICEKEYKMDYDFYDDGILHCKPRPKVEKYDGIKVKIGEK